MILDTSFVFDLLARDPDAFDKGSELHEQGETQYLPVPVIAEAWYGVVSSDNDGEDRLVDNLTFMYPVVEIDRQIAKAAARLRATAVEREPGKADDIDTNDLYIAGVADVHRDAVLTANERHFRLLDVPVETY